MRNRLFAWVGIVVAVVVIAACGGGSGTRPPPDPRSGPSPAREVQAPRLVVVLILDQLASWVLGRHLPSLAADGFLRRSVDRGAVHHVDFPYAGTVTAAGHASIATGTSPSVHGVVANETFREGREVDTIDDGEHAIIGTEGKFASPSVLRSESLADVLHAETDGNARIAAISFKDRAAIFSAGKRPDVVLFYEPSIPGFTTSTYYERSGELPTWLQEWSADHPLDEILGPWQPLDVTQLENLGDPDDQPGEGGHGFDATFPHDARETSAPYDALRYTGLTNEYLLALAERTAEHLEMGRDGTPDLLVVSVSSTDYVGHVFGPESWEYLDNLARLDRALAEFADRLESRGPVSFLLTADHGVAPLVERSEANGAVAQRLRRQELVDLAEARLDEAFGPGDWVLGYAPPFVYLTEDALERDDAGVVTADALVGHPGVHAAFEAARAPELREGPDPVLRAAAMSVGPTPDGEVMVVAAEGWVPEVTDHPETGTNHGTPWAYDRRVPVVMVGPNVEQVVGLEAGDQRRVASTIARLLGVRPPRAALAEPLPGVVAVGSNGVTPMAELPPR